MYVEMFHCIFVKQWYRGDQGIFWLILHDYILQICSSSRSKVIVGNGGLKLDRQCIMFGFVMEGHIRDDTELNVSL